jgi:glycosyltransferase involved in cell wall biosynthesis
VHEELARADVLLNAAVVPTSPKPLLDAQAASVPVVTTEPPESGAAGVLVVPRRDAGALADCLEQLAREPALRRRLADEGRVAASRTADVESQVDRYAGVYRTLVAGTST